MNVDLEELYWEDWDEISKDSDRLKDIFDYIREFQALNLDELAQVLRLYNNPYGAYTLEFAKIIGDIYREDKVRFIRALNLVEDEIPNLVYALRLENVFQDEDEELGQIISLNQLSAEQAETAKFFFRMYKNICTS